MGQIVVTGGAGFIGSHLVDRLILEEKKKVIVVDNLSTGRRENINKKAKFYQLDIKNKKIESIFSENKIDAVFHLAGQKNPRVSVENPILDVENNFIASLKIIELARKYKVKKFINFSTGGAMYDIKKGKANEEFLSSLLTPYSLNKYFIDKYLNYFHVKHGFKYISLRPSVVYGPRQPKIGEAASVISIFLNKFLKNQIPVIFGKGDLVRDYIYIDDVIDCAILAYKSNKTGEYNVGTQVGVSVNSLVKLIRKIGGFKTKVTYGSRHNGDVYKNILDCSKAFKDFKWESKVTLEDGIKRTVQWYKEN